MTREKREDRPDPTVTDRRSVCVAETAECCKGWLGDGDRKTVNEKKIGH